MISYVLHTLVLLHLHALNNYFQTKECHTINGADGACHGIIVFARF